jgi:hypothetical protein
MLAAAAALVLQQMALVGLVAAVLVLAQALAALELQILAVVAAVGLVLTVETADQAS